MKLVSGIGFWACIAVVLGLGGLIVVNPQIRVDIPQQDIQRQIDQRLPFETRTLLASFTVQDGAMVTFNQQGDITLDATVRAQPILATTTNYTGSATLTGRLFYQRDAFYVRDFTLDRFEGELTVSERVRAATGVLGEMVGDLLADADADDVSVLRDEGERMVADLRDRLPDLLAEQLAETPVYRLDRSVWWHWLVGGSLDDLEVRDQTLTVVLGIGTLVASILIGTALVVIGLLAVVAFLRSGLAGLIAIITFGLAGSG